MILKNFIDAHVWQVVRLELLLLWGNAEVLWFLFTTSLFLWISEWGRKGSMLHFCEVSPKENESSAMWLKDLYDRGAVETLQSMLRKGIKWKFFSDIHLLVNWTNMWVLHQKRELLSKKSGVNFSLHSVPLASKFSLDSSHFHLPNITEFPW